MSAHPIYLDVIPPDPRYYDALGRFVEEFATAEATAYEVLRHHAKLSSGVGAALLSGIRISDVQSRLRRLWEAGAISDTEWAAMEPIFQQLNIINSTRDLILHYGARADAKGNRFVTTAPKAITDDHAKTFPISTDILTDMRHDLRKVILHLRKYHRGLPSQRATHPELDALLRAPWRYKPPPLRPVKSRKAAGKDQVGD